MQFRFWHGWCFVATTTAVQQRGCFFPGKGHLVLQRPWTIKKLKFLTSPFGQLARVTLCQDSESLLQLQIYTTLLLAWSTKLTHNKLGVSFFAEYEQINKETRSRADISLNRLRDQMRSRSEPCLSYSQAHRRSKSNQPNSRCLSPLTPRRLHPSPRVAPPQPIVNPMIKSSRRWSIASHPSSGYMTQNSTPPSYSACSRLATTA